MKRILAIDWGEKRVGIALSDPLNITAQPFTVIHQESANATIQALKKIIEEKDVGTIVVGLPIRTDGKTGEKELRIRHWISTLKLHFPNVDILELDERYSSRQAERMFQEHGVDAKKQRPHLDKVAAALILQQYLQMRENPS